MSRLNMTYSWMGEHGKKLRRRGMFVGEHGKKLRRRGMFVGEHGKN